MARVEKQRAKTERYQRLMLFARAILISSILFAVSAFVLAHEELSLWLKDERLEVWGPYQLALSGILLVVILIVFVWLTRIVPKVWNDQELTFVDQTLMTFVFWGVYWTLTWGLDSVTLASDVEWSDFSTASSLGQAVFWTCAILLLPRIAFMLSPKAGKDKKSNFLFSDQPISDKKYDVLERQPIVQELVNAIYNFDRRSSFVIALTGPWGEGKTSVINLLRQRIEEDRARGIDNILIMEFTPWYFSAGNNGNFDLILRNFFTVLNDVIRSVKFRPDVSRLIKRYYHLISPAVEKRVSVRFDLLFGDGDDDLQVVHDQINDELRNLRVKVLVIIDDLDRMTGEEIAFVFKLVRLCADFDNVMYLLSFDREFVNRQIGKAMGFSSDASSGREDEATQSGRKYVDKIVNWDFALPKAEPERLIQRALRAFLGQIEDVLQQQHGQEVQVLDDESFLERLGHAEPQIIRLLNNIRLMKLFLNRYARILSQLIGEVNYFDLLLVELVRFRYPNVYEMIYRRSAFFIGNAYESSIWGNEEGEKKKRGDYYDEILDVMGERDKDTLSYFLRALFPAFASHQESFEDIATFMPIPGKHDFDHKSISVSNYFPRYFRYSVQEGAFSDVEWQQLIEAINASSTRSYLKEVIDQSVANTIDKGMSIGDWLQRMRMSWDKIDAPRAQELAFIFVNNSKKWADLGMDYGFPNLYHAISGSIVDLIQLSKAPLDKLVLDIVDRAPDIELFRQLYRDFGSLSSKDAVVKLKNAIVARLRQDYLLDHMDVFQDGHRFHGLYTLKAFLEPSEYRPYVSAMIEKTPENAVRLLQALNDDAGLNFKAVQELTEPSLVLDSIENNSSLLKPNDRWLVEALSYVVQDHPNEERLRHVAPNGAGGFVLRD